jgi:hypothetical protein
MREVGNKSKPDMLESFAVDNGVKFTLREQQYIKLAANGEPNRDIAVILHVSSKTITRMLNANPNIMKAVEAIKNQITSEIVAKRTREIEVLYDKAQSKIKNLLESDNPWIQMQAMRMVFDRHDKMMQSSNAEENKIAVVFEGMAVPPTKSNAELVEGSMEDE